LGSRLDLLSTYHSLRVNNCLPIRCAAVAGLGIALAPTFLVHAELSGGLLLREIGVQLESGEVVLGVPTDRVVHPRKCER
jgi:DNA-binding transcriptional LysR family regulator